MSVLFFTGFPGFLGSELLPRVLARDAETRASCLVQSKYAGLARRRAEELAASRPELRSRIEIVEGDITRNHLGLGTAERLKGEIAEIYHLAAVYDLGVGRDLAMRVNVEGTRRMLEFASACPHLKRFQYVSTCYVSGKYRGLFSEQDLDHGQAFHNFYEETKFLAETEVQKRMREGLPATIYRPSVVVGDSRTGSTQKYDGPYSVIRLLLRQPKVAILPVIGDPGRAEVNFVPRDFVVDGIAALSGRADAAGKVFHLSDPHPLTVGAVIDELASATGRRVIRVPLPLGLAKFSLRRLPGVQPLIGIPPDALDYFVHPASYASSFTQAVLREHGISCPHFSEYASRLVGFVIAHPEISSAAMA
jgi:thioester reductase-like protein